MKVSLKTGEPSETSNTQQTTIHPMKELNQELKELITHQCPIAKITELIEETDFSSQNLDSLTEAVLELQNHEDELKAHRLRLQAEIKRVIAERLEKINVRP